MEHSHPPGIKNINKSYHPETGHHDHIHDSTCRNGDGKHLHKHGFRSYERKKLLIAIVLTGTMMVGASVNARE